MPGNPLFEFPRVVAAVVESEAGVAIAVSSFVNGDSNLLTFDAKLVETPEMIERQSPDAPGPTNALTGSTPGKLTFRTELAGSGSAGTAPFWMSRLLPACDYSNTATGTFSYARTNVSLTLLLFEDGQIVRGIAGSRGTFTLNTEAGGIGSCEWEFSGRYLDEAAAAALVPTFPTVLPPIAGNLGTSSFTFDSTFPAWSKITVAAGNDVTMRKDGNGPAGARGLRSAMIGQKKPTWSLDPEDYGTTVYNWQAKRNANALYGFNLQLGSSAGNIIKVASTTAQILECPRDVRNNMLIRAASGQFVNPGGFILVHG